MEMKEKGDPRHRSKPNFNKNFLWIILRIYMVARSVQKSPQIWRKDATWGI